MPSQAKKKKEELVILIMKGNETLEIKMKEILEEEDMVKILIMEKIIISDHIAKEEVEIVLNLLVEEEEEVTITKKDLIVFTVGSLDIRLQIVDSYFTLTITLK